MSTLVVGLDGADWDLLHTWLESGLLPTIQRIRQEGVWTKSESQLPPVTSPNWKCYATGKNPGRFGVFWWEIVDTDERQIRMPTSRSFKTRELWDELSDANRRVAILNMPTTYPPKRVNGVMVAGGPDAEEQNFTYPPALEAELKQQVNYRVRPANIPGGQAYFEEALRLIDARFDLAERYVEESDFVHVTIFCINVLQHFHYRDEKVLQAWQLIDRRLERLVDGDHTLFLMSDHGCGPIETVFYINTWLEREGYLVTQKNASSRLASLGITRDKIAHWASKFRVRGVIRRLVPSHVRRGLLSTQEGATLYAKARQIDWDESRVIGSSQGVIYLNVAEQSDDYSRLRDELMQKLADLRTPDGVLVAHSVHRREEVYSGPFAEDAPDIVFEQHPRVHTNGSIGRNDVFASVGKDVKWQAENQRYGIFAAHGRDVCRGTNISPMSILDLAPTILHAMGVPIPDDMDGKVLREIFVPESEPAQREPVYKKAGPVDIDDTGAGFAEEKDQAVIERLKALGYLDQ